MKKRLLLLLLALALLCGCAGPAAPAATADLSGDTLTVHFVDVGQADCALLAFVKRSRRRLSLEK